LLSVLRNRWGDNSDPSLADYFKALDLRVFTKICMTACEIVSSDGREFKVRSVPRQNIVFLSRNDGVEVFQRNIEKFGVVRLVTLILPH
jgi:hypothetical protein